MGTPLNSQIGVMKFSGPANSVTETPVQAFSGQNSKESTQVIFLNKTGHVADLLSKEQPNIDESASEIIVVEEEEEEETKSMIAQEEADD